MVQSRGSSTGAGIIRARILSVDKVKWTCSVISDHGNRRFFDVAVQPTHLTSSGGGQFSLPETNSIVWLCAPSEGGVPFILGGASTPSQVDEGDDGEGTTDMRQNRPVLNEGDMLVASSGSGRIILRRGGVLELGASESAKRIYIPLSNLIREFSQNWEHESGGGRSSMLCRSSDESHGTGKTPAEYQLQWREFCEDEFPMIDIRMGRIQDEDRQKVVGGNTGDIVYRFTINGRYRLWIDKLGNVQKVHFGTTTESYVGARTVSNSKSLTSIVRGLFKSVVTARDVEVSTSDSLVVLRDSKVSIGGNVSESIGGDHVRVVGGDVRDEIGSQDVKVSGSRLSRILGSDSTVVGGTQELAIAQYSDTTVGGSMRCTVANSDGNDVAWDVSVSRGSAVLHNTLGTIQLSVGPTASSPTCKILQRKSGSILIQSMAGAVEVEINSSGVSVKTAGGEISLDSAGTVKLGPASRGNVVTTLTHPVDYVTGAPILGSSSVAAGGVPAPSAVSLPSTFLPDRT